MFRRLLLRGSVVASLMVLPLMGPTASAGSRFSGGPPLAATVVGTPAVLGTPTCDPSGRCVFPYRTTSTFDGDLSGTSTVNGVLYIDFTTFTFSGTSLEVFSGRVAGCGEGTFVTHYELFRGGAFAFSTKGVILDGSGTGDLRDIAGRSEATFPPGPSGGTATVNLKVHCQRD